MTAPLVQGSMVPQGPNGIRIDGGGSSPIPITPTPFTSEALAWFSLWPAPVGDYLVATDATFALAVVSAYAIVPAGSKVTLYQGILSSIPPVSKIIAEWDGNSVPGVNAIRPNAKMNPAVTAGAGVDIWVRVWNTGLDALGVTIGYTGAQQ